MANDARMNVDLLSPAVVALIRSTINSMEKLKEENKAIKDHVARIAREILESCYRHDVNAAPEKAVKDAVEFAYNVIKSVYFPGPKIMSNQTIVPYFAVGSDYSSNIGIILPDELRAFIPERMLEPMVSNQLLNSGNKLASSFSREFFPEVVLIGYLDSLKQLQTSGKPLSFNLMAEKILEKMDNWIKKNLGMEFFNSDKCKGGNGLRNAYKTALVDLFNSLIKDWSRGVSVDEKMKIIRSSAKFREVEEQLKNLQVFISGSHIYKSLYLLPNSPFKGMQSNMEGFLKMIGGYSLGNVETASGEYAFDSKSPVFLRMAELFILNQLLANNGDAYARFYVNNMFNALKQNGLDIDRNMDDALSVARSIGLQVGDNASLIDIKEKIRTHWIEEARIRVGQAGSILSGEARGDGQMHVRDALDALFRYSERIGDFVMVSTSLYADEGKGGFSAVQHIISLSQPSLAPAPMEPIAPSTPIMGAPERRIPDEVLRPRATVPRYAPPTVEPPTTPFGPEEKATPPEQGEIVRRREGYGVGTPVPYSLPTAPGSMYEPFAMRMADRRSTPMAAALVPFADAPRMGAVQEGNLETERRRSTLPGLGIGPVSFVPILVSSDTGKAVTLYGPSDDLEMRPEEQRYVGFYDSDKPLRTSFEKSEELSGALGEPVYKFTSNNNIYYVYDGGVFRVAGADEQGDITIADTKLKGVGIVYDDKPTKVEGARISHSSPGLSLRMGYVADLGRTKNGIIRGYFMDGMGWGFSYYDRGGWHAYFGQRGFGGSATLGSVTAGFGAGFGGNISPFVETGGFGFDLATGSFEIAGAPVTSPPLLAISLMARAIQNNRVFRAMLNNRKASEIANYSLLLNGGYLAFAKALTEGSDRPIAMKLERERMGVSLLELAIPGRNNNLRFGSEDMMLDVAVLYDEKGKEMGRILMDTIEEFSGVPIAQLRTAFQNGAVLKFGNGKFMGIYGGGNGNAPIFVSPLTYQTDYESMINDLRLHGGSVEIRREEYATTVSYTINGVKKELAINRNDEWRVLYPLCGGDYTLRMNMLKTAEEAMKKGRREEAERLYSTAQEPLGRALSFLLSLRGGSINIEAARQASGRSVVTSISSNGIPLISGENLSAEGIALTRMLSGEAVPLDIRKIEEIMRTAEQNGAPAGRHASEVRANLIRLLGLDENLPQDSVVRRVVTAMGGEVALALHSSYKARWEQLIGMSVDGKYIPSCTVQGGKIKTPSGREIEVAHIERSLRGRVARFDDKYGIIEVTIRGRKHLFAIYRIADSQQGNLGIKAGDVVAEEITPSGRGLGIVPLSSLSTFYGESTIGGAA